VEISGTMSMAGELPAATQADPALSFVLCARNDKYMGNPVRRLETALNYLGRQLRSLARDNDAEIIVTDWGSEVPLRTVLGLNEPAARITQFLEVSPGLAREKQQDSPFAEVIALNAAVRRAKGRYVGRIDQDTLVGRRFLKAFFAWHDGSERPRARLETSFLFSRRRQIPFSFAVHGPSAEQAESLIRWCGRMLMVESQRDFFYSPVGIMLLHRRLWEECGGYDERLIYWGAMEVDMAYRLRSQYPLVDLGKMVGHDFYHLEHYDPRLPRATPRRMNPEKAENLEFCPNGPDWGLCRYDLSLLKCGASPQALQTADNDVHQAARAQSQILLLATVAKVTVSAPVRVLQRAALSCSKTFVKLLRAVGRPRRYPEYAGRVIRFLRCFVSRRGS
jgi:hypothetical protein